MDVKHITKKSDSQYRQLVDQQRDIFLQNAAKGRTPEDMERIRKAYEFACQAHETQVRKTGEPYILHPISVARIVNEEIGLGTNPIIASLLHDVVEDTSHTLDEIKALFGEDVAFLVEGLTKEKKEQYESSKQVDNFRKMLLTIQYDIRALLIKLADRLHNMRTLGSMPQNKQDKISGETDYFYAPLANRLGLYKVKTELENLSFRFRYPTEFVKMQKVLQDYAQDTQGIRVRFVTPIEEKLKEMGYSAYISQDIRSEFSIWRHMQQLQVPFSRLESVYVFNIVFDPASSPRFEHLSEKNQCLAIYSLLTDLYEEKVGSLHNYIDNPKANGYEGLHCKLMTEHGTWADVHIKSERMAEASIRGCVVNRKKGAGIGGVDTWVSEFREILKDMVYHDGYNNKDGFFMDGVKSYLYQDDIRVFTPKGKQILLPQNATALDFAYEIHTAIGDHAQFARVNGALCSIKTVLKRGDRVEIGTDSNVNPQKDWMGVVKTYKAKSAVRNALRKQKISVLPSRYLLENCCNPLPGDQIVAFDRQRQDGKIEVHTRSCEKGSLLATENGDSIVAVELPQDENTFYPTRIIVSGVDRHAMIYEITRVISEDWNLDISRLDIATKDSIFECDIKLQVRSYQELQNIIVRLEAILGVESVRRGSLIEP